MPFISSLHDLKKCLFPKRAKYVHDNQIHTGDTVVPAKSDSDVMLCLQLPSKK